MNQIKDFQFNKKRHVHVPKEVVPPKDESPRDLILNDIKKLAIEGNRKLRPVKEVDRRDTTPVKPSGWTDQLNQAIKERGKHLNDNEDDEDEEDDESLTFENEFYNRA